MELRWRRIVMIPLALMFVVSFAVPAAAKGPLGSIGATPNKLSFPKTEVYEVSYLSFWITNKSSIPLFLNNSDVFGRDQIDFSWAGPFTSYDCTLTQYPAGTPLSPGDSCGFGVIFAPIDTGPHKAEYWVQFTDGVSFFEVSVGLSGTGIEPAP